MNPESVAGAVFSEERVLLIKRRDVPVWVLPGGGIDPGETPEAAIVREILEETGFRVKIERHSGIYLPINRLTRVTYLYACTIIEGQATLSAETSDVRFFSLQALPKMPPPYAEWIADAAKIGPTLHKRLTSVTYLIILKGLILYPHLMVRFLLSRLGFPLNT